MGLNLLVQRPRDELLCERAEDGSLVVRAEERTYVRAAGGIVEYANGTAERISFDQIGRPARIEVFGPDGAPLLDLAYTYGPDGRIAQIGPHRIDYLDERVVGAEVEPAGVRFEEDADGNRAARIDGRGRTDYRYTDGRLTTVERDGDTLVTYGYDERGRRVRRDDVTLRYDGDGNVLSETAADGRVLRTYIRDGHRCLGRIDGPAGEPAAEWYHLDHTGTAWLVTDADGQVVARRESPLEPGPGPFMGRFRDEATGFHDFGVRDYDAETGRFTTPDTFTFDPDDPRLAGDPESARVALAHWELEPALRDRYLFCLGDPVNNVDLDGHSAWWFFLTIPSSLTWAIPNTLIAVMIVLVNFYAEILGWIIWLFVMLFNWDTGLKYYPWGRSAQTGSDPPNPYDLDDRDHFWFGLDASARLGVPWALFNGSFFSVGRAFTMGNVIFYDDTADNGDGADKNRRFVVPTEPDVQLTLGRAIREHEMTHVFQYAYMGPFFHCLPLAPVVRLIENAIAKNELTEREKWYDKFDLGGATTLIGGALLYPLTFGKVSFADVQEYANPASWWQHLFPGRFTDIATQAINLNNWIPGIGIYEWDAIIHGQGGTFFERNAGARSGHTYGTLVEVEEDDLYVGQFTRVIGADLPLGPQAPPATAPPSVSAVNSWAVAPDAVLPATAPGATPNASGTPIWDPTKNAINLDKNNVSPVKVTNATGVYFNSTTPGEYTITGTGSGSESQKVKVKDISVTVQASVFVGDQQLIGVKGDSGAVYSLRPKTIVSGVAATVLNAFTYTAGATPGTDVIEVVARYDPAKGAFKTYGDTGLAAFDYVVKEIRIDVKEPTITSSAPDMFVGGNVTFTVDHEPKSMTATANVPGTTFDQSSKKLTAGKGAINAPRDEIVTFDYGVKQYPKPIHVKPIVVNAPASVVHGSTTALTVTGGEAPYTFEIVSSGSAGSSINAAGSYHAGTTAGTDVITATDKNGARGTVSIAVT